ncbi:hypothetical protein R6Q59_014819 [Mikania micrantha]
MNLCHLWARKLGCFSPFGRFISPFWCIGLLGPWFAKKVLVGELIGAMGCILFGLFNGTNCNVGPILCMWQAIYFSLFCWISMGFVWWFWATGLVGVASKCVGPSGCIYLYGSILMLGILAVLVAISGLSNLSYTGGYASLVLL